MKTLLEHIEDGKTLLKIESDKGSGLIKITHSIASKRLPVASVWMSISEFKKVAKELV